MKLAIRNLIGRVLLLTLFLMSNAAFSQSCTFHTVPVPTQGVSNAYGNQRCGCNRREFFCECA
jgi:hypothetical protein